MTATPKDIIANFVTKSTTEDEQSRDPDGKFGSGGGGGGGSSSSSSGSGSSSAAKAAAKKKIGLLEHKLDSMTNSAPLKDKAKIRAEIRELEKTANSKDSIANFVAGKA